MRFKDTEIGKVPEQWDIKPLSEITKIQNGYAFKSKYFSNEGNPVIKIKNVKGRVVDLSNCQLYPFEMCEDLDRFKTYNNDVLIAMTGAGSVGRTSKFLKKDSRTYYLNQRVGKIIPNKEVLNNEFLYQIISTDKYENILFDLGNGSGQPNLSPDIIGIVKIPYPPLEEQKAIANILSTLDEKIEVNNQINKTLENMAQAIFKQWFIDYEFPNEDEKPYKSSGGEMVESELGMIPKGWEVKEIEKLTSLIIDYRGKTPKKLGREWSSTGIIALSAKNIKNGKLIKLDQANRVDKELYSLWMKDELKQRDILLTSEAPLGEIYFIASDCKYCLSQRLFALRANINQIYPEILYMYLRTEDVMKDIKNRATGTTVTGIRQSELRKVRVLKPLIEVQKNFYELIRPVLKKISVNEDEIQKVTSIRDTLLPKLMSGEIRVPLK